LFCDLLALQLAANLLSSGVPLVRSHGGGFGIVFLVGACRTWAVSLIGRRRTPWAAWAARAAQESGRKQAHIVFSVPHLVIDCLLHHLVIDCLLHHLVIGFQLHHLVIEAAYR
jgi:hypothetical protein